MNRTRLFQEVVLDPTPQNPGGEVEMRDDGFLDQREGEGSVDVKREVLIAAAVQAGQDQHGRALWRATVAIQRRGKVDQRFAIDGDGRSAESFPPGRRPQHGFKGAEVGLGQRRGAAGQATTPDQPTPMVVGGGDKAPDRGRVVPVLCHDK